MREVNATGVKAGVKTGVKTGVNAGVNQRYVSRRQFPEEGE